MSVAQQDPVVQELREQISAADRELVAIVNERLRLVERLWAHKRSQGLPLVATDREEWLLRHLQEANDGPLSDAGLAQLLTFVLELTKRELARE